MACDDCHDTDNFPNFTDGEGSLAATAACDDCHSPGGAFDGVAMAKGNWDAGIYESDGMTLKAGKEQWCAACHDDDPAYNQMGTPANVLVDDDNAECTYDGNEWSQTPGGHAYGGTFLYADAGDGTSVVRWTPDLPFDGTYTVRMWNPYNNERGVVTYTIQCAGGTLSVDIDQGQFQHDWLLLGSFAFSAGGSGYVELGNTTSGGLIVNADAMTFGRVGTYAPNVAGDNVTWGFYATGHGKNGWMECLACHDASKAHIDGEHRTYEVDENTGEAVKPYVESYRLKEGALQMPSPEGTELSLRDYALCFDCHNPDEVLGVDQDRWDYSHTNFWDSAPQENFAGNGHMYHLNRPSIRADTDCDGDADSRDTCVTCHNVHGPPNEVMIRHGELISTPGTTDKVPALNFSYVETTTVPPATAMFTSSPLSNTASYDVYAWWTSSSGRTEDATYTVHHDGAGSPDEVSPVDQTVDGGQWNLLGTYIYNAGSAGTVVLDNDFTTGNIVIADAIKWEEVGNPANSVIVDNVDATFVADGNHWKTSANQEPNPYGPDVRYIEAYAPLVAVPNPDLTLVNSEGGWAQHGGSSLSSNHVCRACHGEYEAQYRRVSKLWPKVLATPGAEPETVPNDGTGESLITVVISDPDDNMETSAVTIDLSRVGGSATQPMADNGDGTYSYTLTIPGGTADIEYDLTVTAVDLDGNTGNNEITLTVVDPDGIYLDDTEAVLMPDCSDACDPYTEWDYFSTPQQYGSYFRYKERGDGSGTMTWTPNIAVARQYQVFAWWDDCSTIGNSQSRRSQNVPYTIYYDGGSERVEVDQTNTGPGGGKWNLLGTYPFALGTGGYVVLSDDATPAPVSGETTWVTGDAVKFLPQP
jgi:hypothetical protein